MPKGTSVRKRPNSSALKAEFSRKLLARITSGKFMEKVLVKIDLGLEHSDLEERKWATDSLFKMLPYLLPRQSNGPMIAINNNTLNASVDSKGVAKSLMEYLEGREVRKKELIGVTEAVVVESTNT